MLQSYSEKTVNAIEQKIGPDVARAIRDFVRRIPDTDAMTEYISACKRRRILSSFAHDFSVPKTGERIEAFDDDLDIVSYELDRWEDRFPKFKSFGL